MAARRKRLAAISIGGLLIVGCALFYVKYFMLRSIGSGPAGPAVAAEPFAEIWTDRQVRLVGIGDSVTAGLGANTQSHTYFNRLIANPDDEFADMQGRSLSKVLPNLVSDNFAISGSTSRDHLNVIDDRLEMQSPDEFGLVVMTSGGNDLIHNYGRTAPRECAMYGATLAQAEPWIDAFHVRLDEMLTKIDASFPGGCEIFLADIYDPTDGIGDAPSVYLPDWPDGLAIHARYNKVINEVAAGHPNVHVVPLYQNFLGHGAHSGQFWRSTYDAEDPHYWFFENIEDPNDRGYDAIRRVFLNAIVENSQLVPAER
ncbi:SGNH/GDSL hydrolase family protein [Blastopirellula sp. JC732]|uniref:SGNH/GDSL hydrolase family protein n=1 Tax=Blastopirellula sediminis TaxID=2894196 RepID=A0A9X1SEQ4_9BACT|nr:SGNH/GDSL hydrolase family protein [Blastopirellula sediminis]MCC9604296.1 SGNH/GDSL hydrolase family protein [Blastopirellula sediminis]MCC9626816.1 SGNH/GDSL hydrolase family protein [Blastopirellula sediminis]